MGDVKTCTTATVRDLGPTRVEVDGNKVTLSSTDVLAFGVSTRATFSTDERDKTWKSSGGLFGMSSWIGGEQRYGGYGHLANQLDVCARQLPDDMKRVLNNVARRLR